MAKWTLLPMSIQWSLSFVAILNASVPCIISLSTNANQIWSVTSTLEFFFKDGTIERCDKTLFRICITWNSPLDFCHQATCMRKIHFTSLMSIMPKDLYFLILKSFRSTALSHPRPFTYMTTFFSHSVTFPKPDVGPCHLLLSPAISIFCLLSPVDLTWPNIWLILSGYFNFRTVAAP